MSALLTAQRGAGRLAPDGERLDQLISGRWRELRAHADVECPVCGEVMTPIYGAHARPVAGRCRGCATELS